MNSLIYFDIWFLTKSFPHTLHWKDFSPMWILWSLRVDFWTNAFHTHYIYMVSLLRGFSDVPESWLLDKCFLTFATFIWFIYCAVTSGKKPFHIHYMQMVSCLCEFCDFAWDVLPDGRISHIHCICMVLSHRESFGVFSVMFCRAYFHDS